MSEPDRSHDAPTRPPGRTGWRPDASEGPPIFVTAGAVIVFLYLIKPILLPFLLYVGLTRGKVDERGAIAQSHTVPEHFAAQ